MKPRTQIVLALAVLLGVAVVSSIKRWWDPGLTAKGGVCCPLFTSLDANPILAATNRVTTNTAARHVIAYYFHRTVRCDICLMIENATRAVIEERFNGELAENRLMFLPVDYELPENAHFLSDYGLPCPSLVIVRREEGKKEIWKLLGDTWQLVQEPAQLNAFIEGELRQFLDEPQQPARQTEAAPDYSRSAPSYENPKTNVEPIPEANRGVPSNDVSVRRTRREP